MSLEHKLKMLLPALASLYLNCGPGTEGAGCTSDDNCKGDRVCVENKCVDRNGAGGNGSSGGQGSDGEYVFFDGFDSFDLNKWYVSNKDDGTFDSSKGSYSVSNGELILKDKVSIYAKESNNFPTQCTRRDRDWLLEFKLKFIHINNTTFMKPNARNDNLSIDFVGDGIRYTCQTEATSKFLNINLSNNNIYTFQRVENTLNILINGSLKDSMGCPQIPEDLGWNVMRFGMSSYESGNEVHIDYVKTSCK